MVVVHNTWLMVTRPLPTAKLRVICFPHAGAGGSTYRRWPEELPRSVEVAAVTLPGREARIMEAPVPDLKTLMPQLIAGLGPTLRERPYVLFGHSMGALVAFEVARRLHRDGHPMPQALILSGRRPPHVTRPVKDIAAMTTAQLLDVLTEFGGTPPELLADREILEMFLPAFRADLMLDENHQAEQTPPLPIPVVAYAGTDDTQADPDAMAQWSRYTSAPFECRTFVGGHFFIHESPDVLPSLAKDLATALGPTSPGPQ